ncbi:type II toxin-antitoxin system RelB/DinJ family antitoxin [Arabiibacter massiliensis]|uniref:type II toxin-antitoxin system RelB/DinJ family antitoxin n=1 Tax=Arabiibacter massiliensis TaxID=1870985 RepID=UPI00155A51E9|nr:type II toxin-antitoxin system RelB/DinJ family antitoxin [Arabiibacter massiliensis]
MATTTLNVRMDTQTKEEFSRFCDEIGISASSLMNMFAKTVVKNQAVPFPLTTRSLTYIPERYGRIFPESEEQLMGDLERAAAVPLNACSSADEGFARVRERLEW